MIFLEVTYSNTWLLVRCLEIFLLDVYVRAYFKVISITIEGILFLPIATIDGIFGAGPLTV